MGSQEAGDDTLAWRDGPRSFVGADPRVLHRPAYLAVNDDAAIPDGEDRQRAAGEVMKIAYARHRERDEIAAVEQHATPRVSDRDEWRVECFAALDPQLAVRVRRFGQDALRLGGQVVGDRDEIVRRRS